MQLTHLNIQAVIRDCLFTDAEIPGDSPTPAHVKGEGVMVSMAFHPERLESHREDVRSMLSQLPDDFMSDNGGGMSMLNMPFTKDGEQYGEQRDADALFILGNALGFTKFLMPRNMWSMFPDGMPYIAVTL